MINFYENYKSIGQKIRRFRILQSMTQEKLAESTLLSVAYISKLERADITTGFSCTTAMKIADALGIPVCILLGEKSCPAYLQYIALVEERKK